MAKMIYQHFAPIRSSFLLIKRILEKHRSKKLHSRTFNSVPMYNGKFCSFYNRDEKSAFPAMRHTSTSCQDSTAQNPYKKVGILNPGII